MRCSGMTPAFQREEVPAFGMQVEGTLACSWITMSRSGYMIVLMRRIWTFAMWQRPPVAEFGWLTFSTRTIEVDRALDNLHKSGKFFNNLPSRRESIPMMGVPRPYAEFGRFPRYAICGDGD